MLSQRSFALLRMTGWSGGWCVLVVILNAVKNLSGCNKGCAIPEILRFAQDDRRTVFLWVLVGRPSKKTPHQNSSEPIRTHPIRTHQNPPKPTKTHQNPIPHPSHLARTFPLFIFFSSNFTPYAIINPRTTLYWHEDCLFLVQLRW